MSVFGYKKTGPLKINLDTFDVFIGVFTVRLVF